MFYNNWQKLGLFVYLLLQVGCSGSGDAAKKDLYQLESLANLLEVGQVDEFYRRAQEHDSKILQEYFEDETQKGRVFNYGILFNAGIYLVKPALEDLSQFVDVPNASKCYMNAALYSIANSSFFNDFLEIDRLFHGLWNKRNLVVLPVANRVLRTLREVIYEIRRGTNTTPERIAQYRDRHVAAFKDLNDISFLSTMYDEIISSYDFTMIEVLETNPSGNKSHRLVTVDPGFLPPLDRNALRDALENFKIDLHFNDSLDRYGPLGTLSSSINTSVGSQDIIYLDALFSLLDPWSKLVHYLGLSLFDNNYTKHDLLTNSTHKDSHLIFEVMISNKKYQACLVHNIYNPARDIIRLFKRSYDGIVAGRIYVGRVSKIEPGFRLVAKTKYSSNHQIAELHRFSKNLFETQTFFGVPRFSPSLSAQDDGSYKDLSYFYELKN